MLVKMKSLVSFAMDRTEVASSKIVTSEAGRIRKFDATKVACIISAAATAFFITLILHFRDRGKNQNAFRRRMSKDKSQKPSGSDGPITFSDFLTGTLELTWPKIAAAASHIFTEKVESALEDALRKYPTLLGEVSYKVKFGQVAPEILAVYTYKKHHSAADEGITFAGHMRWETDLEMELNVGPVGIGVDKILLDGMGCLIVKPLLPKEPVIGGLQIYFCDPPELHLHFKGLGGVMDRTLEKVIHQTFANMMVLPNRMALRFGHTKINDYPLFRDPPPRGMVRVHLLEANGLVPRRVNLFGRQKLNPYCIIQLGKAKFRVRTVNHTMKAQWGDAEDDRYFMIYNERQILHLSVYDEKTLGANVLLGSLPPDTTIYDLLMRQRRQCSKCVRWSLNTNTAEGDTSPSIDLALDYFEFREPVWNECVPVESGTPALLSLKLYHVRGVVPHEQAQGIRIRLRVGNQEFMSKKSKSIHPTDFFGFGQKQAEIMHSLYKDNISAECIAKAFHLSKEVVEEVVMAEAGTPSRFGWDEAIHVLVAEPANVNACLEFQLNDRWYPLGKREGRLMEMLAPLPSLDMDFVPTGPGGGDLWPVLDYLGHVSVGVSIALTPATPIDDISALQNFELARLGGAATRKGAKQLEKLRWKNGLEHWRWPWPWSGALGFTRQQALRLGTDANTAEPWSPKTPRAP